MKNLNTKIDIKLNNKLNVNLYYIDINFFGYVSQMTLKNYLHIVGAKIIDDSDGIKVSVGRKIYKAIDGFILAQAISSDPTLRIRGIRVFKNKNDVQRYIDTLQVNLNNLK